MTASHPALVDPEAPWRIRRAVPLSEVLPLAASLGLKATVVSRAVAEELRVDLTLRETKGPRSVMVVSREPGFATVTTPREIAVDTYEASLLVPTVKVVLELSLANGTDERTVTLLTGEHAAALVHGWNETTIRDRAEVQVRGNVLASAILELCPATSALTLPAGPGDDTTSSPGGSRCAVRRMT